MKSFCGLLLEEEPWLSLVMWLRCVISITGALTHWFLVAIKPDVRQQVGFNGWLRSLQDPPYNQFNHTGGCTHKINHLSVAHIAHICGVHLEIGWSRGDSHFILAPLRILSGLCL